MGRTGMYNSQRSHAFDCFIAFVLPPTEDVAPQAKPKTGGGGGGLFGSDDEDEDDLFFAPTKSLPKATPAAKSSSSTHTMTQDQKAALRQVPKSMSFVRTTRIQRKGTGEREGARQLSILAFLHIPLATSRGGGSLLKAAELCSWGLWLSEF